ncbi:hypothetical protein CYY_000533 [Polysphondylium violaceum]|uniref:Palmitoyltransferase n=1 Tax=Polysphondylium violaceum TaxID=133409 RepID=A0A8J4VBF8_9MYCE|nr:hypothetical protein CYY_000533 [Polysphondylium violaceum]
MNTTSNNNIDGIEILIQGLDNNSSNSNNRNKNNNDNNNNNIDNNNTIISFNDIDTSVDENDLYKNDILEHKQQTSNTNSNNSNSNQHYHHHNHNSTYNQQQPNIPYWKTRLNIGFITIIFLEFIFFSSYFPYVVFYCQKITTSPLSSILILFFYHIIFIITQISLFKTTFTDPGGIPDNFPNSISDYDISFYESNSLGEKRKCSKCTLYKPDRSHHCSKCKRCILKMDHHCPFVNNCVGYYNYKFFVLFLTWTSLLCFYVMFTTSVNFKYLIDRGPGNVAVGVIFVVALIFSLGLSVFALTHYSYIFKNETTIEHFEKNTRYRGSSPNANIYNLGFKVNFCEVFGNEPWKWFLPIANQKTPLSGLVFNAHSEKSPLITLSSSTDK